MPPCMQPYRRVSGTQCKLHITTTADTIHECKPVDTTGSHCRVSELPNNAASYIPRLSAEEIFLVGYPQPLTYMKL
jgi:hypothetical protein